jgi:uncharacterized membrane protein YidH (DUF202 family)
MKKATIRCPENGASGSVVWYPETDDRSIYSSLCAACRVDQSEPIVFSEDIPSGGSKETSSPCLVINEYLPHNIKLIATLPELSSSGNKFEDTLMDTNDDNAENNEEVSPLLQDQNNKPSSESGEVKGDFQGQLLKFNRINAHLANERTYLAWARTVMSVLSVVFTLRTEAKDSFKMSWSIVWFVTSVVFMLSANYTWFNGWTRYVRVKEICLTSDLREAEQKMQRDGLGFSRLSALTYLIAFLLIITTIIYCWYGTAEEVWEY